MKANEFKSHLVNDLIPFWNRLRDDENGGFYGYADAKGVPDKKSDKGCILNSRILWFYSSAYSKLGDPKLLEMAEHAYRFLADYCFDRRYGGVFWSVKYDGSPADTTKHTYNQAFAIYALSAYYIASGSKDALNLAYTLYNTIEDRCRDFDGYLEAFKRDWRPESNEKLSENGVMADRTMNTLLHVLEAYTELYRADGFYKVGDNLREILKIFKDKVYNYDRDILEVFFDMDYNTLIDLESFGHDIEASWLIDRACEVLGDKAYHSEMLLIVKGLAKSSLENGFDRTLGAMCNECEAGKVDRQKVWWVQGETVTGFMNAYKNEPDSLEYLALAERVWKFIQSTVIDKESGEWFESIPAEGEPDPDGALVHMWKCPYHNGRMCLEMMERLED